MRVFFAAGLVVLCAVIGYASTAASAQTPRDQAGLMAGEKVRLFDAKDMAIACTVVAVRGDFVGCQPRDPGFGRPRIESWYNLRLIPRIDRTKEGD